MIKHRTASRRTPGRTVLALAAILAPAALLTTIAVPAASAADGDGLRPLGAYYSGAGETGAEIVSYDPATQQLYITNGATNSIDIVSISDPSEPALVTSVDLSPYGTAVQSVAVGDGVFAAALDNEVVIGQTRTRSDGSVAIFDTDGSFVASYPVGNLPDALAFSPDKTRLIVANEGEPVCEYVYTLEGEIELDDGEPVLSETLNDDPEGSISIIDLPAQTVSTAVFTAFDGTEDALRAAGIRIFTPYSDDPYTASMDIEPEYPTVSADGSTAFVTLQENNAIAVVDIATSTVTDILPLGYKDHSMAGNGLDPSNEDGPDDGPLPQIGLWNVMGMYMPDTIATADIGGETYLFTANEGDSREWPCAHDDDVRVKDLDDLDGFTGFEPTAYPQGDAIADDDQLGRLKTTLQFPTAINGDGAVEQIYSLGARSFSIWNTDGVQVFDSGDDFERLLLDSEFFNTSGDEIDERSDDKGPEPEAIAVGTIGDRTFAFIGMERSGGVAMYDVSDPATPELITYVNTAESTTGDSTTLPLLTGGGDIGPESITFIASADSPTGKPMLAVANEISGTTRLFEVLQPEVAATTTTTAAPTTTISPTTTIASATTTLAAPATTTVTTVPGTLANVLPATGDDRQRNEALIALVLVLLGGAAIWSTKRAA